MWWCCDYHGGILSSTSQAPLNGAGRFAHIDAMRAFAVMLVVVAHAGLGHIIPGGSGVTIFFSISGFIITYLLLRERDRTGGFSVREFYLRRLVKIGPPLLVALVVPSLIFSFFGTLDWAAFIAQIFFYFNWYKVDGGHNVMPGTDVVWSLSIEEQFYIAFALIWLIAVKSRHWRTVTAAVALVAVLASTTSRVLLAVDPLMTHRIYYGSDTRIDGIGLGVLAAIAYHCWQERGGRPSRLSATLGKDWVLVGSLLVYVLSLVVRDDWFRDTFRFTLQSIAACLIIVYGLLPGNGYLRQLFYSISRWRVVQVLGLASYSIYLVHLSVAGAIHSVVRLPLAIDVAVTTLLGVLLGVAMYRLVEVPIHAVRAKARARSVGAVISSPV